MKLDTVITVFAFADVIIIGAAFAIYYLAALYRVICRLLARVSR